MNAECVDSTSSDPQWSMDEIKARIVGALNKWLEERPKRRKNLKLVHYEQTPVVKPFGSSLEQGCVFMLKIASGAKFPLVAIPSEQTRQEFVKSCRVANCFVPAITPILEEKDWQLLARLKRLVLRMVKSFKHFVRHHRRFHPGRYSRVHCNRAAVRAVMI